MAIFYDYAKIANSALHKVQAGFIAVLPKKMCLGLQKNLLTNPLSPIATEDI